MRCERHTLRHDAFDYESDEEFAERMTPIAVAGPQDGEAVVAVVAVTTVHNAAALREALGGDAEGVSSGQAA